MENFDLISFSRQDLAHTEETIRISHAVDLENKLYFIRTNDIESTLHQYDYEVKKSEPKFIIPDGPVLLIQYLTIDRIICIVTQRNIHTYSTLDGSVTTFAAEKNIITASWDLTETKVILMHDDGEIALYLYSCNQTTWFKSATTKLQDPAPNFVQVGWGSEDTQFRGKNRTKNEKETPQSATDEEILNKPPIISWRDNNQEFAVNYTQNGRRCIKVFNDSCAALFENSSYPGLQHQLSFSSAGYIAAITKIPPNANNSLVIFERNCKERHNYPIDDVKGDVISLQLHKELNALIIHSQLGDKEHLTLFNYYCGQWFVKQQLSYPVTDHKIVSYKLEIISGTIQSFLLNVITNSTFFSYHFRVVIQRSKNFAAVAVINGTKLEFTFYEDYQIPAPMYSLSFSNESVINKIIFNELYAWCAVIDESCIKIVNCEDNKVDIVKKVPLNGYNSALNYLQCFWDENTLKLFVKYNDLLFDNVGNDHIKVEASKITQNILPFSDSVNYNQLIENSHTIYATNIKIDDNVHTFSVDWKDSSLKLDDEKLFKDVTSFFIYKTYLLVTMINKLHCIRLTQENISKLLDKSLVLNDFYTRSIEDGARIVCVTQKKSEIILLLPRGNIETITCRPILIDLIENLLNEAKWSQVIHLIRVHKLNSNLLIDLDPNRFISNIENFISSAKCATVLCNLCMDFTKENCFDSLYKNCFENKASTISKDHVLKITLKKLEENISAYFDIVVLMKLKHFSLRNALICVLSVFINNQNHKPALELCRRVINKILLYTNQGDVYNQSLQLYNVDFVAFIANCCSLDPKLYEPQLDKLRACPTEIERNYMMNVMAKNMQQAVKYLIRFEKDENNVINFVNKHGLVEVAYKTCPKNSVHFVPVSKLYAEQLYRQRLYNHAGLILKQVKLYEEALMHYKKALNVPQVVYLLAILNSSDEERKRIVSDLVEELVKQDCISDASVLCESYLHDYERSIRILLENRLYTQAITAGVKYNCSSDIKGKIEEAVNELPAMLHEKMNELETAFIKHSNRLQEVRKERRFKKDLHQFGQYVETGDAYSEYGSQSSRSSSTRSSRSSSASKRSRMKEEKRKIDLRIGGIYEDIALMRHLYNLIVEAFNLCPLVKEFTNFPSCNENTFEECRELHKRFLQLQNSMKCRVEAVWPSYVRECCSKCTVKGGEEESSVLENIHLLDIKYKVPPKEIDEEWTVSIFLT